MFRLIVPLRSAELSRSGTLQKLMYQAIFLYFIRLSVPLFRLFTLLLYTFLFLFFFLPLKDKYKNQFIKKIYIQAEQRNKITKTLDFTRVFHVPLKIIKRNTCGTEAEQLATTTYLNTLPDSLCFKVTLPTISNPAKSTSSRKD